MAAKKEKDIKKDYQTSLIPLLEREEQQIRREIEQVRVEAENHIHQSELQAEQHIQEGRRSVSELVERTRKERLTEFHIQADQIRRSSEKPGKYPGHKVNKNIAKAVQIVVDAVTTSGDEK